MGDWGHIYFGSGSDTGSVIRRAVIRYGGRQGIPDLYHTDEYPRAAIGLDRVSPTLENITFYKNYRNGAELYGGDWLSHTWGNTSVVYWLSTDISVPANNTLVIVPGAKIKATANASIFVSGKLRSDGSPTSPITFASEKDDDICGTGVANEPVCDTNNDSTASVGQPGDWGSIQFASGSDPQSSLSNAVIRHAGIDSVSSQTQYGAVRLVTASPTIADVRFASNYHGLELLSGAHPTLTCNDFEDNKYYGIYNIYSSLPTDTASAELQWWGNPSGPAHATNPTGTGDRVSDGVDFTPWRDSGPCTTSPEVAPTANFDAEPTSGAAPLTVSFRNLSSGKYTSCLWDYGDNTTRTACYGYHDYTYATPGTYTVQLTVSGLGDQTQERAPGTLPSKAAGP